MDGCPCADCRRDNTDKIYIVWRHCYSFDSDYTNIYCVFNNIESADLFCDKENMEHAKTNSEWSTERYFVEERNLLNKVEDFK
jgi:hypothetical protein